MDGYAIKNVPDESVRRLRQRAERNHRSLQGELMAIIESAARQDHLLRPSEILAKVRGLGLQTPAEAVDLTRADRDGRR